MSNVRKSHGRGTSGKRGLGSGSDSHKTSGSKPASLKGYKQTQGTGHSGKGGGKSMKY